MPADVPARLVRKLTYPMGAARPNATKDKSDFIEGARYAIFAPKLQRGQVSARRRTFSKPTNKLAPNHAQDEPVGEWAIEQLAPPLD